MATRVLTAFCCLSSLLSLVSSSEVRLPRRLTPEDDVLIALPSFSSMQMDDTFHLAKDIVTQRRKLEADLVKEGMKLS